MKFFRLFFVCLLAAVSATCRAQSVPASPQNAEGARLVLPVATYNFGDVPRKGGNLVKEFVFRNEGSAPLVIVRVLTSCSCFKATFPRKPVAPGHEGVIRVVYEPLKSEPGMFSKVLQIYSNSVTGRELLTVQGNSVE